MEISIHLAVLLSIFLGLSFIGVPIAFSLIAASIGGILAMGIDIPLVAIPQRMSRGLDSFPLLAIPLFVLAANLMNRLGVARRIFELALAFVGHIKGGLAHVNILASTVFAGMSGVAQADAAGLGIVEMEAMRKEGYEVDFSAAVTAASSTIGPVIPPSVTMVIYALMAGGVSLARLFLAGFIPGIMMALFLMSVVFFLATTRGVKGRIRRKPEFIKVLKALREGFLCLLAPIILVGGILLGAATPTELGALTVVYVLFLGAIYRELTIVRLFQALTDTVVILGALIFIISCAFAFGLNITLLQIPNFVSSSVLAITSSPEVVLAIGVIILLVVGTFMESTTILILFTPVIVPLILAVGVDLVHFGIVLVLAVLIGALTPPFGICLYIVGHIGEISIWKVARRLIPFYIVLILCLLLLMYIPTLSLFLPNLLLG